MSNSNYYQELNVQRETSDQEIKAAYRKLAFEYHPDRNKSEMAAERMKSINEAYAVLSDPAKRRQYDMFCQQYGDGARTQFRQNFSEQDIFNGSDIHQIFEEMARGFGLRGFEDIFKDIHGQGGQRFEFSQSGRSASGFVFNSSRPQGQTGGHAGNGMMGKLARKLLKKLTGLYFPQEGGNLEDVIVLQPEVAFEGGPYAYYHRSREKKLVVQIPKSVRDGQIIRLNGMGEEGTHGAQSGDLLLKVRIRTPWSKKIRDFLGFG